MSSGKIDRATIIILDIGRNVSTPEGKNEKSFFCNARECTVRIIERQIMSQMKNLVGIILLGSKDTKNSMAEQYPGSFKHIELLVELQIPTWKMIEDLPDKTSNRRGDWFDALIVATDHFKNGFIGKQILNKKIILMTNFKSPATLHPKEVKSTLEGFKQENFEVDVIGIDLEEAEINEDIEVARQFVEGTDGATATFDYTMRYLLFHKKKARNAIPWNVDLSIGPNIKIPVSSYVRLKDEPVVKKWMAAAKDPVSNTASTTQGIIKNKIHINIENQTVVESDSIIKGYHYGQKIIPFSDCDKTMLYESGEKCLAVYGFTDASNIKWENLNGDGLSYIFGRKGDKKAQAAIRCLVQCLHELNLVGIVRRVYNKGNAPKMFALMPVIDANNFICLSMIGICYKEDIKNMAFPPTNLKKYTCTDEQVDAFKELIRAMDLTKAYDETYDDTEAFPIAETVSPSAQYVLDCIAFRAMNPGKPLPPPRDDIMMLFKVPPLVEKRSREPLEKLKKLFTLNKVETKTRKRNNIQMQPNTESTTLPSNDLSNNETITKDDMPKIQLPNVKKAKHVDKIGTIDPVMDFKTLFDAGKTLADLSPEMTKVIEDLVYCNLDGNYSRALNAMTFYREECVKADPSYYNNWVSKFKTELIDRKKDNVISMIADKNLSYILKSENSLSTFDTADSHEESQLYENDTIPNSTELTIRSDVNDLFDEM